MAEVSRRQFLQGVGAGLAAAAASACSPTHRSLRPLGPSPLPSGPPNWTALQGRMSGTLVLPASSGYAGAAQDYNELFDSHQPGAIAQCATASDVQACLEVASAAKLPVAARSGGHSYAGYSNPTGGLVIDLSPMSGVQVHSDGTATVGAGARVIDVYGSLAAAGRAIPGGSCPTVGIGGLTLGGGVGVLSRQLGLTIDHLTSARVVTPDSVVRTASATATTDLFWALRGGGGGNFGVVTSFSFVTVAAPDIVVFGVSFPGAPASAVLGGWQDWIQAAPPALWANCIVSAGSSPTARINGSYLGAASGLTPVLDDLAGLVGAGAGSRSIASKGFLDAMLYFAGCSSGLSACHLPPQGSLGRESFVASSRVMDAAAANPAAVTALVTGRSGIDLIFDSLGGAVAKVGASDTAFPHRSALASVQIYAGTIAADQGATAEAVGEIRDGLAPLVGSGAYVNYIDPALPDWPSAYYGANLARLEQVLARYDPHGVLAFPQGIGAARSGAPVGG